MVISNSNVILDVVDNEREAKRVKRYYNRMYPRKFSYIRLVDEVPDKFR